MSIDTIPKLDEFLAAKNKRLGIPHVSLIAPKIETYLAASESLEEALVAPEYRPSAHEILEVLADHYSEEEHTIAKWLCKMNFDVWPLAEVMA